MPAQVCCHVILLVAIMQGHYCSETTASWWTNTPLFLHKTLKPGPDLCRSARSRNVGCFGCGEMHFSLEFRCVRQQRDNTGEAVMSPSFYYVSVNKAKLLRFPCKPLWRLPPNRYTTCNIATSRANITF